MQAYKRVLPEGFRETKLGGHNFVGAQTTVWEKELLRETPGGLFYTEEETEGVR